MRHAQSKPGKRTLMTGVKAAGATHFQLVLHGNRPSRFPPLTVEMTLGELSAWLRQQQALPDRPRSRQLPLLRIVP
ncbi:MAG: hypothetical protein OEW39_05005 [Deltaproteobacteria bacterium]|nr:hypothetical protein [Deltaproteobacteria bacterium]